MCCAMLTDVSRSNAKAKRVKLFGDSEAGQDTRQKLESFCNEELYLSLEYCSISKDGFVCHRCRNEIAGQILSSEAGLS